MERRRRSRVWVDADNGDKEKKDESARKMARVWKWKSATEGGGGPLGKVTNPLKKADDENEMSDKGDMKQ